MQFAVRGSIKTMGQVVAGREVIDATTSFQSKQRIRSSSVVKPILHLAAPFDVKQRKQECGM
jgi:hypothetical protein